MPGSRSTTIKKQPSLKKQPSDKLEKIISPDHLHQKAFSNSLQASIIFMVDDGNVITANRAACKLLGYSKKELLTKNRNDIFNFSEADYKKMMRERKISGSARADLSLIKKSGKQIPCEVTSVVFKDSNGISNSIMTIVDLRERMHKQEKIDAENQKVVADNIIVAQSESDTQLREKNNWIKSIVLTSYDVIWEWDIQTNFIAFGKTYENVFGFKLIKNKLVLTEWLGLFQPEEASIVKEKLNKVFESEEKSWEETYQLTSSNNALIHIISRANIIRDVDNKPVRLIGVIHDQSKIQKLEGILEQGIRIKEKQIIEAIVEAKEIERSDLGMELHDNINQLLGASMLYLKMARKDVKNADIYLIHSSEYTLTAIEELRRLSKGLSTDKKKDFKLFKEIERTVKDTMETYPVIIHCSFDESIERSMSAKFKVNSFRIFQEQLMNIIKHAQATVIDISISKEKGELNIMILDNGIGFDSKQLVDGIGISNIKSRAELYKGNVEFITEPGKGCNLRVSFPELNAR